MMQSPKQKDSSGKRLRARAKERPFPPHFPPPFPFETLRRLKGEPRSAPNSSDAEREALFRQLQKLSADLEIKVQERTAELLLAHERLKQASSALIGAQEVERRHLACELHDEVGQSLTGL